eukprot:g9733.t1
MPATPDAGTDGGDCVLGALNAESDAAPSASSTVQARSDVDGSITKDRVLFRDVEDFERKRHAFAAGGSSRLQIISDFDFTMTKFWVNGRRGESCHAVIDESGLLAESFHERTTDLRNHYYPLEVSPGLSHETRVEMMVEWVTKAHEAMVEAGITKGILHDAVAKANLEFRPGHGELLRWIKREGVPLLMFSAGIADVLEEAFRQHSEEPLPSTCQVISNRMGFDADGNMTGFVGECFHVFNKHASSAEVKPYFQTEEMRSRDLVLLLGDSLGDLNMAKGVVAEQVLTVGFLNDKVEERTEAYVKAYDVVILGDCGFDFVLNLLQDLAWITAANTRVFFNVEHTAKAFGSRASIMKSSSRRRINTTFSTSTAKALNYETKMPGSSDSDAKTAPPPAKTEEAKPNPPPPQGEKPKPPPTKDDSKPKPPPPKQDPKPKKKESMGDNPYQGQNKRALIWGGVYFLGWIVQRLWCHLGFPDHCDLAMRPLDVLTDLVVLFTFSLAQAWWCEILLDDRFDLLMKAPWVFIVVLATPPLISALGLIDGLERWDRNHEGEDFEFSAIRSTIFIFGLIAAVLLVAWHFARAWLTLPGMQLVSGSIPVKKPEQDLHGIYAASRIVVIAWCILFTSFLISEDNGFDYRGALLAWMLSLIAVFPHPVSYLWLGVNTGIFIQGIGANRLRFLGCDEW